MQILVHEMTNTDAFMFWTIHVNLFKSISLCSFTDTVVNMSMNLPEFQAASLSKGVDTCVHQHFHITCLSIESRCRHYKKTGQ